MDNTVKAELIKWALYIAVPAFFSWLGGRLKTPKRARKWDKYLNRALSIVECISLELSKTNKEKQADAVKVLIKETNMPESVANYLIEKAVLLWKSKKIK